MPGKSGNPTGFGPGMVEVRDAAAKWAPKAVETLAQLMLDEKTPAPARILACTSLLDRAYGRPKQHSEVDVSVEFSDWSKERLKSYILDGMAKMGLVELPKDYTDAEIVDEQPYKHSNDHLLPYSSRDD